MINPSMERTADRYRCWVQTLIKRNNMSVKNRIYSVRVNFKSKHPNVKLSPASMTGIVTASSIEQAGKAAVNFMSMEVIKSDSDVFAIASKITPVTSKFAINAKDWLEG